MAEVSRLGKARMNTAALGKSVKFNGATFLTGAAFDRMPKIAVVALNAVDTAGGVFAWKNPEGAAIVVKRVTVDVTTKSTGACTISIGQAANGTTSSANLIDTLDVGTATGNFDNYDNHGTNGKGHQRLAATDYVTGSKATGATAGLVGSAYIEYHLL